MAYKSNSKPMRKTGTDKNPGQPKPKRGKKYAPKGKVNA